MSDPKPLDPLTAVFARERDDAREELAYERQRQELTLHRLEALRADNAALREQLKTALTAARGVKPAEDLTERLKLAIDSNRRLERELARVERELEEARQTEREAVEQATRLNRRIRALEGSLRMAQGKGTTEG